MIRITIQRLRTRAVYRERVAEILLRYLGHMEQFETCKGYLRIRILWTPIFRASDNTIAKLRWKISREIVGSGCARDSWTSSNKA